MTNMSPSGFLFLHSATKAVGRSEMPRSKAIAEWQGNMDGWENCLWMIVYDLHV